MSDTMETIQRSMRQTEDCQRMCEKAMEMLKDLMGAYEKLKIENAELKRRLGAK